MMAVMIAGKRWMEQQQPMQKVVSPRDKPKLTTILHQPEELDQVPNIRNIFKIFGAYRVSPLPSPPNLHNTSAVRGAMTLSCRWSSFRWCKRAGQLRQGGGGD